MWQYILVCTGIYQYVLIFTSMYMDEHSISQTLNIQCFIIIDYWMSCTVHGRCVHWYCNIVKQCPCMHKYQCLMWQYIPVYTVIYQYVLIYTSMYMDEHSISQTQNIQCFITWDCWISCTVHGRCVHWYWNIVKQCSCMNNIDVWCDSTY